MGRKSNYYSGSFLMIGDRLLNTHTSQQIYRIDKFFVPGAARQEFVETVHRTQQFLRTLPGFIQDSFLEQTGGPGEFNFITIAIWDSAESVEAAKKTVAARYEEIGFNPQEMFVRLGIKADLATYQPLEA
jgi:heme-degrading monooxygenase HmoA